MLCLPDEVRFFACLFLSSAFKGSMLVDGVAEVLARVLDLAGIPLSWHFPRSDVMLGLLGIWGWLVLGLWCCGLEVRRIEWEGNHSQPMLLCEERITWWKRKKEKEKKKKNINGKQKAVGPCPGMRQHNHKTEHKLKYKIYNVEAAMLHEDGNTMHACSVRAFMIQAWLLCRHDLVLGLCIAQLLSSDITQAGWVLWACTVWPRQSMSKTLVFFSFILLSVA